MASLSPAVRKLLVHAIECDGAWMECDPIRMAESTVKAAERRGLVVVERTKGGELSCVTITAKGRAELKWF